MTYRLKGSTRPNLLGIIDQPVLDHNLSKHIHITALAAITPDSKRPPEYYTPPAHDPREVMDQSNW